MRVVRDLFGDDPKVREGGRKGGDAALEVSIKFVWYQTTTTKTTTKNVQVNRDVLA